MMEIIRFLVRSINTISLRSKCAILTRNSSEPSTRELHNTTKVHVVLMAPDLKQRSGSSIINHSDIKSGGAEILNCHWSAQGHWTLTVTGHVVAMLYSEHCALYPESRRSAQHGMDGTWDPALASARIAS